MPNNFRYADTGFSIFKQLKENPVLFLPNLVMILITFLAGLLFYYVSGFKGMLDASNLTEQFEVELFQQAFLANWMQPVFSAVVFILFTFIIGVGIDVLRFNLVKALVKKKKLSIKDAWKNRNSFFWKIVGLKIYVYVLNMIGIGIGGIFIALANLYKDTVFASIFWVITGVWFLVFILFVSWGLLFRYPIMFLKDKLNPWVVFKESFLLFNKERKHVILTWGTLVIGLIILSLMGDLVSGIFKAVIEMGGAWAVPLAIVVVQLINFAVQLLSTVWKDVFVFRSFLKN